MKFSKQLVSLHTIIRKELVRICRIWPQTFLPPVVTTALYLIIFGRLIGSRLEDIEQGVTYMGFIIPGLIMMTVITSSYNNAVTSFFIAKFEANIEELLISPTPNYAIILGYVISSIFRGLLSGSLVYIVSSFFHFSPIKHLWLALITVILASATFALIGLVNAFFARKFDDISWVPTFILTPLTYLGGVFFTIELLPTQWQKVAMCNPVLYIISAFRYAFIEVSYISTSLALYILSITVISLFTFALYMMHKGIGLRQ